LRSYRRIVDAFERGDMHEWAAALLEQPDPALGADEPWPAEEN
jgi:hypothetical protein